MKSIVFDKDSTELNGFLQKGNRSLFFVSSSHTTTEEYSAEKALDTQDTYFHSHGKFEHWYRITINGYFYIKSYTLKARHSAADHLPQYWKVNASKDGINWKQIDYQSNGELDAIRAKKNYDVQYPGTYKHFVIAQIKTRDGLNDIFTFGAIDLFGKYIPEIINVKSCRRETKNAPMTYSILLLITL